MSERIRLLEEFCADAEARVRENPTRANIIAFDEAAKRLEDARASEGAEPVCFKTQAAAIIYLKSQGWKVEKSKFSDDFREGLIVMRDGSFASSDLDRYAEVNLDRLDNSEQAEGRLSEKEMLIKEQRRKLQLANDRDDGKLTPTEDIERMLAGRAARLKADLLQFWRDHGRAIVRLVGGDETKTPDLIEYGIDKTDEHLSRYTEETNG